MGDRDINTLIKDFLRSFQRFFDGKRYKLINFAQKLEVVDKVQSVLIISQKELTMTVHNNKPRVDNRICKKNR